MEKRLYSRESHHRKALPSYACKGEEASWDTTPTSTRGDPTENSGGKRLKCSITEGIYKTIFQFWNIPY